MRGSGLSLSFLKPNIPDRQKNQKDQIDQRKPTPAMSVNSYWQPVAFHGPPLLLLHSMRRQYLDGTGYALACQENFGCRPLTHSLKKRKDETVRRLVPIRLIPNQGGGEMEDLSPPDHNGPPS